MGLIIRIVLGGVDQSGWIVSTSARVAGDINDFGICYLLYVCVLSPPNSRGIDYPLWDVSVCCRYPSPVVEVLIIPSGMLVCLLASYLSPVVEILIILPWMFTALECMEYFHSSKLYKKHLNILICISRRFKDMCTQAFTTLRSKGNLILTVFAMLLSTGIPELQHPDDLDYIRDTLAISKDEKEAELVFQAAFQEAYDKRRSTSLNFLFHNVKQFWIN